MGKGRGKGNQKGPSTALQVSIPPPPKPYTISLTKSAEDAYLAMKQRSDAAIEKGDDQNQHCKTFRIVDDAIRRIIPADPTNHKYSLHQPLDGFFRIAKGRLRIAWAVETELREILILYVSDELRKDGDVRDPYVVLNQMAKTGLLQKLVEDWKLALYIPPNAPLN
ncbi:MAG TPA: type II toxin-antitoxin system YhaV family toxin [Vicinamibacterales bacterium]|nr:type II toxin-antitoxin system YhaV family toxin [Vicinamibacterales bacterium]